MSLDYLNEMESYTRTERRTYWLYSVIKELNLKLVAGNVNSDGKALG